MNPQNAEFSNAATAIRTGIFIQSNLESIKRLAVAGQAHRLVCEVVASEGSRDAVDDSSIVAAMRKLQDLANSDLCLACILMAHLWPIADERFMHEVCDSIDLWISDCRAAELTHQLKLLAESEADPNKRRHYQQWIDVQARFSDSEKGPQLND